VTEGDGAGFSAVLAADSHLERVARSAHLAYEKVTLTPAAAAELGTELSEADAQRQQIGMSGRKGLGVKADDLIERLETELGAARARIADGAGRTPFDPWVVGGIVLVALVAAGLALRRRHLVPAITDL